ncbi:MAG TPA: hypothetical protein VMV94_00540 [Phycisphaerae bacterium]|nr:hypothetical protein [Phycisphaerae bacterium]
MLRKFAWMVGVSVSALLLVGLIALAQEKPKEGEKGKEMGKEMKMEKEGEKEMKIPEAQVPPAALATLKKMAGSAKIEQFEEKMKHDQKIYKAEWKTAEGEMEVAVTAAGDLLATEEPVMADKVPAAVKAAAEKEAGMGAKIEYEKKTVILYEAKFKKGDKEEEVKICPTGKTMCGEKMKHEGMKHEGMKHEGKPGEKTGMVQEEEEETLAEVLDY